MLVPQEDGQRTQVRADNLASETGRQDLDDTLNAEDVAFADADVEREVLHIVDLTKPVGEVKGINGEEVILPYNDARS